jgi:hypothetical protein
MCEQGDLLFRLLAHYRVKPVNDWLSQEKGKLTPMLTLFAFLVSLFSPAPTPAPATTPTAAASAPANCWCQTIPLKDWGK